MPKSVVPPSVRTTAAVPPLRLGGMNSLPGFISALNSKAPLFVTTGGTIQLTLLVSGS